MLIVLSKQAWRDAGGFAQGLHYVDRIIWKALRMTGHRIYLIQGLYVYHWHRGGLDGIPSQEGIITHQHTVADGRKITLVNPKTGLPPPSYADGKTDYGQGKL